jgi:hypothetical protein
MISQQEYNALVLRGGMVMKFDGLNGEILIICTTNHLEGTSMEHETMSWNILEVGIFV